MHITSSSIQLDAETTAIERHEKHESLTLWEKGRENRRTLHGNGQGRLHEEAEQLIAARQAAVNVSLSSRAARTKPVPMTSDVHSMRCSPMDDLKLDILRAMIEKLTGKKIAIVEPEEIMVPDTPASEELKQADQDNGFGIIYDFYESHYEYESMNFSAAGTISTSDGREISFSVDLNMTHEFYTEQHVQLRAGEALKDPLAVNFSGSAAELTRTKFSFDIDADGRNEQIAFLKPGSGFLALDRNGDGKINDGRELFGALTGDGFSELADFDTDHNSFIDENDSIYDRLRIWQKDDDGRDRLLALGQMGIGAIFLGSIVSPFDIKDHDNNLLGRIQSNGIFIRENGSAGTMQQIDLVV